MALDAGSLDVFRQNQVKSSDTQRITEMIEKEGIDRPADQMRSAGVDVTLQSVNSEIAQEYDPLLVALARYQNAASCPVDVIDAQAEQLADPQTSGIHDLEEAPIAKTERGRVRWRAEETFHFIYREDLR